MIFTSETLLPSCEVNVATFLKVAKLLTFQESKFELLICKTSFKGGKKKDKMQNNHNVQYVLTLTHSCYFTITFSYNRLYEAIK